MNSTILTLIIFLLPTLFFLVFISLSFYFASCVSDCLQARVDVAATDRQTRTE